MFFQTNSATLRCPISFTTASTTTCSSCAGIQRFLQQSDYDRLIGVLFSC